MKKHIGKIKSYFLAHKIISVIVLVAVLGGGYWGYNKLTSTALDTRYVTAKVEKGTIISSISGSGQVSASNQLDIKPKVSGEITAVYIKAGQEVNAGAILAAVNSADAERAMRDAETALETAKLELDKILEPLDELTLLQAETSLAETKESKQKAKDNIKKAYDDGFNTVSNVFLDLPGIMTGLNDMFFKSNIGTGQWNIDWYEGQVRSEDRDKTKIFKQNFVDSYYKAKTAYDTSFDNYKVVSRTSDNATVEALITQTYDTTRLISDAIKNANNYLDLVNSSIQTNNADTPAILTTHKASLNSYTSKTNTHLSSLLSLERSLKDSQEAIVSADRTIAEKELSLAKTKEGPDDLDIRAKKIAIQQREDALTTAKQTLSDHYIRAPFAGVIAKVNARKGDSASAGTAVATLITKQKIAEISLNEVDVTKVKIGQKATLTFDAIEDLTITGEVIEVDLIGTVSQGVVSYIVKIGFDTGDGEVRSGMTVSANIITDMKQDVLTVPSSAVKTQGNLNYVEIVNEDLPLTQTSQTVGVLLPTLPTQVPVVLGLSSDESVEIISGLTEGDQYVVRKITTTTTSQSTSTSAPSLLGGGGARTGGGNFPR